MKRAGIDLHVVDGRFQGLRTHVLEVFPRLIQRCPEIRFFLFSGDPDGLARMNPAFTAPNVTRVRMRSRNPALRLAGQLPALQRRYRLDLFHSQFILPLAPSCRCFVTIHDLLFETHPQFFGPFFTFRSRLLIRRSARLAAHVFTVSEASRSELTRLYSIPPERVTVIHNAADVSRFFPGEAGADLVARRGLVPGRYVLTVGRLEPRKNHANLIRAYMRLGAGSPPLVCAGQKDFGYGELDRLLGNKALAGRVRVLQDVGDDELPALYRHAMLFAYPAFAEGFGLPPLEAMASGVPVIISDDAALREVAGDAALGVHPDSPRDMAESLDRLINDQELRRRLSAAGIERSRHFSWETSAERMAAVYKGLASGVERQCNL